MQFSDFVIKDSLFDPSIENDNQVSFYQDQYKRIRYKVWLYIEGPRISYVDYVVYKLHSSFKESERKVERSIVNPNCKLAIWTWGIFNIKVNIFLKNGEVLEAEHYLTFNNQFKSSKLQFKNTGSFSE
jgi:transcription initiation factor IIF auxiliary subunit